MKLDPYRFVGKDDLRPNMMGVYHKKGYIYATDAHILIRKKTDYPKSLEGKVIDKKGKVLGDRYPDADGLISSKTGYVPYSVDVNMLANTADACIKSRKSDNPYRYLVLYPQSVSPKDIIVRRSGNYFSQAPEIPGTPGSIMLDPYYVKKLVHFMKAEKTDTVWMNKISSQGSPVMAYGQDSVALLMPVSMGYYDMSEKIDLDGKLFVPVVPLQGTAKQPAAPKQAVKTAKPKTVSKKEPAYKPKITGRGKYGYLVGNVVDKFNDFYRKHKIWTDNHISEVKKSGKYANLEVRIAYDIARMSNYLKWDFLPKDSGGFISMNDSELKTLLVQGLKKSEISLTTKSKPKTNTTMRKTTTKRKTTARKSTGGNTIARAASILKGQKKEYQRIFAAEVKKRGVDSRTAAEKAGSVYRKKYGSTPTERWRKAIGKAKKQGRKIPDLPF